MELLDLFSADEIQQYEAGFHAYNSAIQAQKSGLKATVEQVNEQMEQVDLLLDFHEGFVEGLDEIQQKNEAYLEECLAKKTELTQDDKAKGFDSLEEVHAHITMKWEERNKVAAASYEEDLDAIAEDITNLLGGMLSRSTSILEKLKTKERMLKRRGESAEAIQAKTQVSKIAQEELGWIFAGEDIDFPLSFDKVTKALSGDGNFGAEPSEMKEMYYNTFLTSTAKEFVDGLPN